MNKIALIALTALFQLATCNKNTPLIELNQVVANNKIELKLSNKHKKIIGIKFPKKIILNNKSNFNKSFIKINYLYNLTSKEKTYGIILFLEEKKYLIKIPNNKGKKIKSHDKRQYIFYTRHFVDSSKQTQQQLKPYIDKMLSENKDTLHIGTVREFKSKHGELFEKLTKNDSISIQFLEGNELGERITVPVEW